MSINKLHITLGIIKYDIYCAKCACMLCILMLGRLHRGDSEA